MQNKQYLTFRWHDLQYGIEAALVQEIFPLPELTIIPEAPTDMIGILNFRGQLIPIMHLDVLQGNPFKSCKLSDHVIVMQWEGLQIGIVVHKVSEVLELHADTTETGYSYGLLDNINTTFIFGVAKVDAGNILLLDLNTLIGQPDTLLMLIWDAQSQLDITTTSPTSDVEQQLEESGSNKADLIPPFLALPDQEMKEHNSLLIGEELGGRLTEPQQNQEVSQQSEELQTLPTLSSFYDLYCPRASPEDRAIFRQRADNLSQVIENLTVTNELIPLAVISFGNEYFGLNLELVRAFTDITNLTPIPCCPNHIVGNMNLRGEVITLVDIRNVLNLPAPPISIGSKVVVVQVDDIVAGLPVDRVLEMVELNSADITPLPITISDVGEQYLQGNAFFQEKLLKVLDLPKIFTKGELVVEEEV